MSKIIILIYLFPQLIPVFLVDLQNNGINIKKASTRALYLGVVIS